MQRIFSSLQVILVDYILISFVSCNSEMHTQREIIQGMEQAVKKNTSDDFLRPLIGLCRQPLIMIITPGTY